MATEPIAAEGYRTEKSRTTAGLFALFLGFLGVHKFYLGYFTTGFIMLGFTIVGSLFSLGIAAAVMWLIGIIEGVVYLAMTQESFVQTYIRKKKEWF